MHKSQMDLTQGPIFKNVLIFSLPILAGTLISECYNLLDSVIVGQFIGANALAAVSASSPANSLINLFLIGLQTGSSVVVGQKVGSHDTRRMNDAISTLTFMTLMASLILTLGGCLSARAILRGLGTPDEIFRDASLYMTIVFIGTCGQLIYNVGTGVLRGLGDSAWPFFFLVLCTLLNVILNLVAVLLLHTGVAGVAAATAISQMVSGIGIVMRLNRSHYGVQISLRNMKVVKSEARLLGSVVLPSALQNIGNSVAALFMQSYVNFFGADFAAANTIVNKVENFSTIPIMAVSSAICAFAAQNIGAGHIDRVHKSIRQSCLFLLGTGCILCAGIFIFRSKIPLLFTTNPAVLALASRGVGIICFICTFYGFDRVLLNVMRASGHSVVPMITAQFGCAARILLGYLIGVRLNFSTGIFYALLLGAFARMSAIVLYYYCFGGKQLLDRSAVQAASALPAEGA